MLDFVALSPDYALSVVNDTQHESFFALDYLYRNYKNFPFFHLAFQQKVDLYTGELMGYEALLRCTPKGMLPISPAVCIEWLESRGYLYAFQDWLLLQCVDALKKIPDSVHVSVNLCASTLTLRNAQHILKLCQDAQAPIQRLHIEMTETKAPQSFIEIGKAIYVLRHHGFKIALDDFGTGHATMKYLLYTDLDAIKIDRSYVQGIAHDCTRKNALRDMVSIIAVHTSVITFEGIEDPADMQTLQDMFEHYPMQFQGQGYGIGYPGSLALGMKRSA